MATFAVSACFVGCLVVPDDYFRAFGTSFALMVYELDIILPEILFSD